MTNITVKFDSDVELVDYFGSDERICQAARVSTLGTESLDTSESTGLLRFLMKNRHGSPFEHGGMTFRITAPIFVWREFMRHRIGFSYNEQSGRYKEFEPVFYMPSWAREMVQVGKTGEYKFIHGSDDQYETVCETMLHAYTTAWEQYEIMLDNGIAREVARMVLPTSIFSTAYVTCNPRSLMSFLSLRTISPSATYKSYPMFEIAEVAWDMEAEFNRCFPITQSLFTECGRVAP